MQKNYGKIIIAALYVTRLMYGVCSSNGSLKDLLLSDAGAIKNVVMYPYNSFIKDRQEMQEIRQELQELDALLERKLQKK